MSNTFVKLPTGDIEIDHIREMYEDLKGTTFHHMKWKPRPALVDKKGKTTRLYTGQKFDPNYIDLVEDGWTHDHCQICFVSIGKQENQYTQSEGYFDGYDWLCKSCFETFLTVENLEEVLAELPQYQK
jgi:hypothetical protein